MVRAAGSISATLGASRPDSRRVDEGVVLDLLATIEWAKAQRDRVAAKHGLVAVDYYRKKSFSLAAAPQLIAEIGWRLGWAAADRGRKARHQRKGATRGSRSVIRDT